MDHKNKILFILALIFSGLGFISIFQIWSFAKTRLVFCDVGQGDGILVASGTKQVVIDGGPGNRMIDCLGDKMPFWDRQIEMVVLTHPQRDHLEGLIGVMARYEVKTIVTTKIQNNTDVFRVWNKTIDAEGAKIYEPDVGDKFILDSENQGETLLHQGLTLEVLWPPAQQIEKWQDSPPADLNETSIVTRLSYGDFCAYFTGDLPKGTFAVLASQGLALRGCGVLKISHHGSKTGTNQEIIDLVKPKIAVIQVGKNSFGHPHQEVIEILESNGVKILRNDINGTIEIESDGRIVKVKVEREK